MTDDRDPIARYERTLSDLGVLTAEKMELLKEAAHKEIEDAVAFAEASPDPDVEALLLDVYAD